MSIGQVLLVPNLSSVGVPKLTEYFLQDFFTTPESSPLVSPRDCEPGPGQLEINPNLGEIYIDENQRLVPSITTDAWGQDVTSLETGISQAGVLASFRVKLNIEQTMLGFHNVTTPKGPTLTPGGYYVYSNNIAVRITNTTIPVATFLFGDIFRCVVVSRNNGVHFVIKGGADYPKDTLVWVDSTEPLPANLYAKLALHSGPIWADDIVLAGYWTPTPLASDSFDRPNNTDLNAEGGTDGAAVEEEGGDGLAWNELIGTWSINANELKVDTIGPAPIFGLCAVDSRQSNVLIQTEFQSSGGGNDAVCVRCNADASIAWLGIMAGNVDKFAIWEVIDDEATERGISSTPTITAGQWYSIVMIADDEEIIGYFDSANRISYDSAVAGKTSTFQGYRTGSSLARYDDFVIWPRHPRMPRIPSGPDPFTFLLHDQFSTETGPYSDQDVRLCEPGPGSFTMFIVDTGGLSVNDAKKLYVTEQTAPNWNRLGVATVNSMTRELGKGFLVDYFSPTNAGSCMIMWETLGGIAWQNSTGAAIYLSGPNIEQFIGSVGVQIGDMWANADYNFATVLRSSGNHILTKGGPYQEWTHLYVYDLETEATAHPSITILNSPTGTTFDDTRVTEELWYPTPLASDSFERPNSANLGLTDGAAVEEAGGDGIQWQQINGAWDINNNLLRVIFSPGPDLYSLATVDANKSDVLIQVQMTHSGGTVDGTCFRFSQNLSSGWVVECYGPSGDFRIKEWDGVDWTTRANVVTSPFTASTIYGLTWVADRQDVTAYYDDANRISYPFAERNETATLHGCRGASASTKFDNFVIWDRHPSDVPYDDYPASPSPDVIHLLDRFTTPDAAPITSPRTCEPGPGTLTFSDPSLFSIDSNGRLQIQV